MTKLLIETGQVSESSMWGEDYFYIKHVEFAWTRNKVGVQDQNSLLIDSADRALRTFKGLPLPKLWA